MGTLFADVRFGLRMLAKNPTITAISIVALALGIGANAALFAIVKAVLFRPLPYRDPGKVVIVWNASLKEGWMNEMQASVPDYLDWAKRAHSFESLAAYTWTNYETYNLASGGEPERLRGSRSTAGLLHTLGIAPLLGRDFTPEEQHAGSDHVAILTYGLWKSRFGANKRILGSAIEINHENYTVVGVLPADFQVPALDWADQILLPLNLDSQDAQNRATRTLVVTGRLSADATLATAQAEMNVLTQQLAQQFPATDKDWGAHILPVREEGTSDAKQKLPIYVGIALFVLCLACANVAGVLTARLAGRQNEIVVRLALGATRSRLVRQLITESLILAVAAGGLAILMAFWGTDLFVAHSPVYLLDIKHIQVSWPVFLFATGVAVLSGAMFGMLPALGSTRFGVNEVLNRSSVRLVGGSGQTRLRGAIVVVEIGLTLVLLTGSGLVVRSVWRLHQRNLGFDATNVLMARISLDSAKYPSPQSQLAFFTSLRERLKAEPGVQDAAIDSHVPFGAWSMGTEFFLEGQPRSSLVNAPRSFVHAVSANDLSVMGIPILEGRDFRQNARESAPVVIVNQTLAQKYFAGHNPVGKRITLLPFMQKEDDSVVAATREIIGVVPAFPNFNVSDRPFPAMWVPDYQNPVPNMFAVVRAQNQAMGFAALRNATRALDSGIALHYVSSLQEKVDDSFAPWRFEMLALALFATFGILLSAMGIYAVVSFWVTQRTNELGVRMALGASSESVLWLILSEGLALAALGVGAGIVAAFSLSNLLSHLLYGVTPRDPLTFALVIPLMIALVVLAIYLPARRAARLDPMIALRYE